MLIIWYVLTFVASTFFLADCHCRCRCSFLYLMTHDYAHTPYDSSRRGIGPLQKPLPDKTQHTHTKEKQACPSLYSNPQSPVIERPQTHALYCQAPGICLGLLVRRWICCTCFACSISVALCYVTIAVSGFYRLVSYNKQDADFLLSGIPRIAERNLS